MHLETKDCTDCRTVKELLWSCCVMLWFLHYEKNFHGRHGMIIHLKWLKIFGIELKKKISSCSVYIYCYIWMFCFTVFIFSVCACLYMCVLSILLELRPCSSFLATATRISVERLRHMLPFVIHIYLYTSLFKYMDTPKFLIRILIQEF